MLLISTWLFSVLLNILFYHLSQDVLLICCTPDWISQNHVLASSRMVLRSQSVLGLNRAPCLAVLLERLPLLLQEQHSYERVGAPFVSFSFFKSVSGMSCGPQGLLVVVLQSHVAAGDQLVHSAFLQSLASLTIGLSLEKHLCRYPHPPHHSSPDSRSCPPEWSWLATFATTIRSAEAISSGTAFPESFIVPEFQEVDDTELAEALVSEEDPFCALEDTSPEMHGCLCSD